MTLSLKEAIIELDEQAALEAVRQAMEQGVDPLAIAETCAAGLQVVGERFEAQEYYLSELIMGAEVFRQAMAVAGPALAARGQAIRAAGDVVIGTVQGDIHDLGKNMVVTMLAASGFTVHDLGIDVPPARFVEKVREVRPQVVGFSALLTVSFAAMKETVEAFKAAGLRDGLRIMVGGGPVDEKVKTYVGADACGYSAMQAVEIARRFVGVQR